MKFLVIIPILSIQNDQLIEFQMINMQTPPPPKKSQRLV